MMRILLAMMLLAIMVPAHAGEFWSGLWRNADQQGEALLQRGDAGTAAKVYADPRRKAYAKLKAGDYQGAAKDLGELHDSDADYNRGNALAHAGDLQGALDAYDAALKDDPNNQDAKHNRELVANALKQQPPQQQKSGDNKSQDEKKDGQQGKDSSEQNKQGDPSKKNDPSKQGEKSGKDSKSAKGQDSGGQNKQEQQSKEGQKPQEGKPENGKPENGKQAGQDKNGQRAKTVQADNRAGQDQQGAAKDDAEQARRDAEASLSKPEADGKHGAGDEANASTAMPGTPPKTEKQIAQEQWLRSIPEDPGGLLRRKFMIEHMMRQQKAQP